MKLVLLLFLLLHFSSSLKFKEEWHEYIASIIQRHLERTLSSIVLVPQFPVVTEHENVAAAQFFLPEVIIWDPLRQFPAIFSNKIPPICPESNCGLKMTYTVWQDGSCPRYYPRCIYGSNGCVVLVCQIFRCQQGHFMTGCDPRILQHFKKKEVIPFILFHKSGVTRELQLHIFRLCSQGRTFLDIQMLILWSVQDNHAQRQIMFEQLNNAPSQQPQLEICNIPTTYISNDFIANIFLITFCDFQRYMFDEMYNLTSECISCDHTFKMASHVGIVHDSKWIPQYDSLFIIQNEKGQVLFWQLTMGTAYRAINDGMLSLKSRLSSKDKAVKMVIIDNCCMWRRKLKGTFGDAVEIKLDLFHAVKRVTTALSKKHVYFYSAVQDFRLVFRSFGDGGTCRKQNTPPPPVIHKNIDLFLTKWEKISDIDGKPIITPAVRREIQNLIVHIDRGCLSGIPPHIGMNRNENLHRSLNKRLSGTRLGVEVAVALLTTFFHFWNARRRGGGGMVSIPASYALNFHTSNVAVSPKFGIGVSNDRSYTDDNMLKTPKTLAGDMWTAVKGICEGTITGDREVVYSIVHCALSLLHAEEVLNSLSDTHSRVCRLFSFQIKDAAREEASTDDSKRLQSVLASFNMQLVNVPRDGDCLFFSISLYLQRILSEMDPNTELVQHLHSLNITSDSCSVQLLRNLLVDEWIMNKQDYQPFFQTDNFDEDAKEYKTPGTYATSIGDAMLLGLSNVLRLQMIVFTSVPSWPYTPISPRCPPLCQQPIYLAYQHSGNGHYSLAILNETVAQNDDSDMSEQQYGDDDKYCRCGRGRNRKDHDRTNCCNKTNYASRCPCLRAHISCKEKCQCHNCGNQYGKRPQTETPEKNVGEQITNRRKRERHPQQDKLRQSGWKFMKKENEQTISGIWTPHEHHVFSAIVSYLRMKKITVKPAEIATLYTKIKEITIEDSIPIVLTNKTEAQHHSKLQHFLKEEGIAQACGTINYLP